MKSFTFKQSALAISAVLVMFAFMSDDDLNQQEVAQANAKYLALHDRIQQDQDKREQLQVLMNKGEYQTGFAATANFKEVK